MKNQTFRAIGTMIVLALSGRPGSFGGANGTGSTARFDEPSGLALHSAGNIYVAAGLKAQI